MRNVIMILTDQQRFDTLGCLGAGVARTPHIDRLAAGGTIFQNHIVANPVCSPSRGCIMTGRHTTEHGLWANGCTLPHDERTIPGVMSGHGFQTAHFGKLHLEPIINRTTEPHHYGFDVCEIAEGDQMLTHDAYFNWLRTTHPMRFVQFMQEMFEGGHDRAYTSKLPEELHLSNWVTDRTVDWLEHRRKDDQPFFLSVGYFDPHHAFNPVEPYASQFADVDVPGPLFDQQGLDSKPPHYGDAARGMAHVTRDAEKILEIRRAYHAMCAHVDACVGRLIESLTRLGLADDTVVLFSSDHGEMLGEHGLLWKGPYLLDDLLRVPMIAAIPGAKRADGPATVDEVTSTIDLMATIQSVANVAPDQQWRGSGIPMLDADLNPLPDGPRPYAVCEWEDDKDRPQDSLRCIRSKRHKLVHYNNADDGELYDLENDPREIHNLFHESSARDVRRELEQQLQEHHLRPRPATTRAAPW